jgi:spore coat protein CotH
VDAEYLRIYTVIEQVDKAFLKTAFPECEGLFIKPEGNRRGFLSATIRPYREDVYFTSDASTEGWQRLMAFEAPINRADEQFRKEIGTYLDVDSYVRFQHQRHAQQLRRLCRRRRP